MNESIVNASSRQPRTSSRTRYALSAAILLVFLTALLGYRAWTDRGADATPTGTERISASELEGRYGLGVWLIGVTAGGGMIDFRLKILDVDKARGFLQDPANLPRLIVADSGVALMAPQGTQDDIQWEEGGILFMLFPNSGGAVKPGTSVIVAFGDMQLEPMTAQ